MAWTPNLRKGVHPITWDMLNPSPVVGYHGGATAYDGSRYIYYLNQSGTTATSASTTQVWQYDTWTDGWGFLATVTSGNQGMDIEYDPARNCLLITHGAGLTSWQIYNLNTTAITVANQSIPARSLATITLVLPAAASLGASISSPDEAAINGATMTLSGTIPIDTGVVQSATTTVLTTTPATATFGPHMVGMYVEMTSGTLNGQRRLVTAATENTVTVTAFGSAPDANDTFVIEVPELQATGGGTTSTVIVTGAGWTANQYRDMDVLFLTGALAGQRRRIASNDATTLTLNAAVTGNPRTGTLTGSPAATDWFRIIPSSDFLYYFVGTAVYRLDMVQTTGSAWSASLATIPAALGGGSNSMYPGKYAPNGMFVFRGSAANTVYYYNMGLRTWTTVTSYFMGDTFSTGASVCMVHGRRRIFFQKEGTTRTYFMNIATGVFEPGPTLPYAAPSGYDGKRARHVISPDGVEFLYFLRAGSFEFYRIPLEWLV